MRCTARPFLVANRTRTTVLLLAAAGAAHFAAPAEAYTTFARWTGTNVTVRSASVSFPVGPWRNSLSTVVSRFNQNPSRLRLSLLTGDNSVGHNNGQNEIWFSANSAYNPATTRYWRNFWTGRLQETDVVFYNQVPYTTSMSKTTLWPYGGSRRPFQTTAMHEFGHVGGLGHESDEYNIMGQDWTHLSLNGSTCRSYVGEDASDGLVALYGRYAGGAIEDLGVVHWRWSGRSGAYSRHALTRMFSSSNALLGSTAFNGQRRYNVNRGQLVRAEFTWENNGETTKSANIAFYLSTNSFISTGDRRIGTGSLTLGRADVYTIRSNVRIPTDLVRGRTYYLGAMIDYDNRVAEVTGVNNTAYHIIRVN